MPDNMTQQGGGDHDHGQGVRSVIIVMQQIVKIKYLKNTLIIVFGLICIARILRRLELSFWSPKESTWMKAWYGSQEVFRPISRWVQQNVENVEKIWMTRVSSCWDITADKDHRNGRSKEVACRNVREYQSSQHIQNLGDGSMSNMMEYNSQNVEPQLLEEVFNNSRTNICNALTSNQSSWHLLQADYEIILNLFIDLLRGLVIQLLQEKKKFCKERCIVKDKRRASMYTKFGKHSSSLRKIFEGKIGKDMNGLKIKLIWDALPIEVKDNILARLPFEDIFRCKLVCKEFHMMTKRDTFQHARANICPSEGLMAPMFFYIDKEIWEWQCFDVLQQIWWKMPSLITLPKPDPTLFKDFFVAGGGGLLCFNVGKQSEPEHLIIYHPLTQLKKELPPLIHRRHPVLIHILVDDGASNVYKIIVAGSSAIGTHDLSRKTEVYDSETEVWHEVGDIPGLDFALNEYQTGAYSKSKGILFCLGFLSNGRDKGILGYNVKEGAWLQAWSCPLPAPLYYELEQSVHYAIAQLVECNDGIYLFSEQEHHREVTHCIHKLDNLDHLEDSAVLGNDSDLIGDAGQLNRWMSMMVESKKGNHGLLVYPEFICVPHGEGKFCIFNTIEHTGMVYDVFHNTKEPLNSPPKGEIGLMFHSLNPLVFAFQPSFKVSITPDRQFANSNIPL